MNIILINELDDKQILKEILLKVIDYIDFNTKERKLAEKILLQLK